MISVDVKISGDIREGLDKYSQRIRERVIRAGAAAGAKVLYDELDINTSGARKNGPGFPPGVVSGNLHDSIYRAFSEARSDENQKAYHVGVNKKKAFYWGFVEYGTSKMLARPYLRTTFILKIKPAIKAALDTMRRELG